MSRASATKHKKRNAAKAAGKAAKKRAAAASKHKGRKAKGGGRSKKQPRSRNTVPVAYAVRPHRVTLPETGGNWMKMTWYMGEYSASTTQKGRMVLNPGLWHYHKNPVANEQFSIPEIWMKEIQRNQKYALKNLRFIFTPEHGTAIGSNVLLRYRSDSSGSDGERDVQTTSGTTGKPYKIKSLPSLNDMLGHAGEFTHGPHPATKGQCVVHIPIKGAGRNKYLRFFNEHRKAATTVAEMTNSDIFDNPLYLPSSEEMEKDCGVVEFAVSGMEGYKYFVQAEVDIKLSEWTDNNQLTPGTFAGDITSVPATDALILSANSDNTNAGYIQCLETPIAAKVELPWAYSPSRSVLPDFWQVIDADTSTASYNRIRSKEAGTYVLRIAGQVRFTDCYGALEDTSGLRNYLTLPEFKLQVAKYWQRVEQGYQAISIVPELAAWASTTVQKYRDEAMVFAFECPWVLNVSKLDVEQNAHFRVMYENHFEYPQVNTPNTRKVEIRLTSMEIKQWYKSKLTMHQEVERHIADGVYETVKRDYQVTPRFVELNGDDEAEFLDVPLSDDSFSEISTPPPSKEVVVERPKARRDNVRTYV